MSTNAKTVLSYGSWKFRAARLMAACALLVPATAAMGQVRQIQTGRALDANPMVGTGGYNAARPVADGINNNLIITGNVTGGRSFQGFSPIQNPNAILTPIPSSSLSNFVRDSVGLPSIQSGVSGYTPEIFFAPSQTAVTSGEIAAQSSLQRIPSGAYRVGQYQYQVPIQPLTGTEQFGGIATELPNARPAWRPTGVGIFRPDILVGQQPGQQADIALATPQPPPQAEQALPARPGQQELEPGMQEGEPTMARPLQVQPPGAFESAQPGMQTPQAEQTASSLLAEMRQYTETLREQAQQREREGEQAIPAPLGDRLGQPADLSLDAAARRPADELRIGRTGRTEGQQARMRSELTHLQASELLKQRLATPIRTLAGQRRTQIDNLLARAEELMSQGEYYRAAATYSSIINTTPDNPLAWMGRANALLAAGEYVSAYLALQQAIERYPRMLLFDFDLPSLVGNREVLDVRRAELERTLETQDDYRIRFLLGYLEYFGGLPGIGLETIQQAAQAAPADSIVPEAYRILAGPT